MRMFPREFPPKRRRKPRRRAEQKFFNSLAGSPLRGFAYYEWRQDYDEMEVDFIVWIEHLGRGALQIKGGIFELIDAEFHRHTRDGLVHVASSPIDEVWLGALDLHDEITEKAGVPYNPFVVPMLALPDMDPDVGIENLARRKRVRLLWRADSPAEAVAEVLRSQPVRKRLSWERIAREVEAVTDGLILLDKGQPVAETSDAGGMIVSPEDETKVSPWKLLRINVAGVPVLEARARDITVNYIRRQAS